MKIIKLKSPATTANLGSGFDVLGLSLKLFNIIEAEENDKYSVCISGYGKEIISKNENNLIIKAYKSLFKKCGEKEIPLSLRVKNNIPVFSGLGSSASAIVGGLFLANGFINKPLTKKELFSLAVDIEGHPDNVSAAIFGGLTISYKDEKGWKCLSLKPPKDLKALIVFPDLKISTKQARMILPDRVRLKDAVYNLSRIGLIVHSFHSGDVKYLKDGLNDRLHQNSRISRNKKLQKLFFEIEKSNPGLGVALSGSGPSIVIFYNTGEKKLLNEIKKIVENNKIKCELFPLMINHYGTEVIKS